MGTQPDTLSLSRRWWRVATIGLTEVLGYKRKKSPDIVIQVSSFRGMVGSMKMILSHDSCCCGYSISSPDESCTK